MKKIFTGKIWTIAVAVLTFLIAVSAAWIGVRYYISMDFYQTPSMFLEGEYAVDGGEWQAIDADKPVTDHFHQIVFKGRIPEKLSTYFKNVTISSKNVWYTIKTSDGTVLCSYRFEDEKIKYDYIPDKPMALRLSDTPGYKVNGFSAADFTEYYGVSPDEELFFEVEYPYDNALVSFCDCVSITAYYNDGIYLRFFFEALPFVGLFILVCFFGLFFFPVASFILGKVDYRYLAFGFLSFFWGLYMIMQSVSNYLNLWIYDPTVCLLLDKIAEYCFVTALLLYFKANMRKKRMRLVANIILTVFLLGEISVYLLHLCGNADLTASSMMMNIVAAVCMAVMIALLCVEMKGNRNALFFLLSWVPLMITAVLDILDGFIHFPGSHYFNYGLTVTMIVQIVALIFNLRQQYLNMIRYEQMQKELYEAKVSVMVSQIRPHFMYNALSSIAMMCTLDPETAQEATVTFADYLRGNMDSLKQTAPVPFEVELAHLKKYLYIEKLRFADLLNVEYDIQATDFRLPLLSIQPLVENAVKHGVGMKEDGGTVKISTRETENAYEVIVEDDGVGFDTNAEKPDDGRSHVGMENTKKRLHDMCGGEVIITSAIGKGTTAKVILPKEGQTDENTVR